MHDVAFTRNLLHDDVEDIVNCYKDVITEVFVDDTPLHKTGRSQKVLHDRMLGGVMNFDQAVKGLKLTLRPKAVIVSSDRKLVVKLRNSLKKNKDLLKAKHATRDSGLVYSAARTKIVSQFKQWMIKLTNRSKKIAAISESIKRISRASAYTSGTWGHQNTRFSPERLKILKRAALNAAGLAKKKTADAGQWV